MSSSNSLVLELSLVCKLCLSAPLMSAGAAIQSLVQASLADGMVLRRVSLASADVVFFKGIVEANNGLAQVYAHPATEETKRLSRAERRSELSVVASSDSEAELDELLRGLGADISIEVSV